MGRALADGQGNRHEAEDMNYEALSMRHNDAA